MEQASVLPFNMPGALAFSESDSESSCILNFLEEDLSPDALDFETADFSHRLTDDE